MSEKWTSSMVVVTCAAALLFLAACSDSSDSYLQSQAPAETPPPPLLDRYELSSPDSIPSGFAFDPSDRAFYVGGINGGGIVRVSSAGEETVFREADFSASLWGAKIDDGARRLWLCARDVDGVENQVWIYDLESGELTQKFLLAALWSNGDCNDLVLDDQGIAYVTDPANPNIYRLDAATSEGVVFASDPLLVDVFGLETGLNGIVLNSDQTRLIVGKVIPGDLFTLTLADPATVVQISLEGDALTTPDGMSLLDGDVYTAAFNAVHRIRFNADYSSATVVTRPQIEQITGTAIADGRLYVSKSDAPRFLTGGDVVLPFEFFSVDLAEFD